MRGQADLQHVFIYVLCNCDPEGYADFVPGVIADDCGLPLDRVQEAIRALCEPDPLSRSAEMDGRRLEPLDDRGWGWRVVNHEFYKRLLDPDVRRAQWRKSQSKRRADKSTSVNIGQPPSSHTDVDTDADAEKKHTLLASASVVRSTREAIRTTRMLLDKDFAEWYEAFPRHIARIAALKAYRKARKEPEITAQVLLLAAKAYATETSDRDKDKIKYPATWLNGGCWTDEAIVVNGNGTSKEPWYGPATESDWARKRRWQKEGILG